MNNLVKFLFSIQLAVVLMLALEYIVLEGGPTNAVVIFALVLATIIYRAIPSLESKETNT